MAKAKGKPAFGGKKAAPFAKGGGRQTSTPRDSKGRPRKTSKSP
jgi:hypothetical protein